MQLLKFSLLTLGCLAPLFHRSRAARDKISRAFVLQLLRLEALAQCALLFMAACSLQSSRIPLSLASWSDNTGEPKATPTACVPFNSL